MIDTHCHLEKALRGGYLDAWLAEMETAGVSRCITVGTALSDWELYRSLAQAHSGRIAWTVGLHPCSVEADWEDALAVLPSYFMTEPLPVALGEIGLDYYHLPKYEDERAEVQARQRAAFAAQLELAYQFGCPVVIHSRAAFDDCVALIDRSGIDWSKVVFHCFAEGPEQMAELTARGGFASFTGVLTYKSADNIRAAAQLQGLDKFMVETDAPYLTPEPHRGQRNQPAYVRHVLEAGARLFGVSTAELDERTTATSAQFFGLK